MLDPTTPNLQIQAIASQTPERCNIQTPTQSSISLNFYQVLHPQAQLTTSSARSNPILALMKLRNTRYSSDTFTSQLSKLLAIRSIHINESIHVSNDEALDVVGGLELPLCAKTV